MKNRVIVAFLTAVIFLFSSALSVFAHSSTELETAPHTIECECDKHQRSTFPSSPAFNNISSTNSENLSSEAKSPSRAMCINCYEQTSLVCMDNVSYLVDKGYHRGFLGLFQTDCLTYYNGRRGVELCENCDIIITDYGIHYCYEVHTECGKGTVDVCPYGITYGSLA